MLIAALFGSVLFVYGWICLLYDTMTTHYEDNYHLSFYEHKVFHSAQS